MPKWALPILILPLNRVQHFLYNDIEASSHGFLFVDFKIMESPQINVTVEELTFSLFQRPLHPELFQMQTRILESIECDLNGQWGPKFF